MFLYRDPASGGTPAGADTEHVEATYAKGVLEVVVPVPMKQTTKVTVSNTKDLKS